MSLRAWSHQGTPDILAEATTNVCTCRADRCPGDVLGLDLKRLGIDAFCLLHVIRDVIRQLPCRRVGLPIAHAAC
jgi:hypothetical protein